MCVRCQYCPLQSPMTNLKKYLRFIIRQTSGSPDRWNNNFLLIWLLTFLKTQCVFANPTYVNRLEKHCTAVWQSNTATYDNRKKGQLVTKLLGWAGHICSVAHPNQEQNICIRVATLVEYQKRTSLEYSIQMQITIRFGFSLTKLQ